MTVLPLCVYCFLSFGYIRNHRAWKAQSPKYAMSQPPPSKDGVFGIDSSVWVGALFFGATIINGLTLAVAGIAAAVLSRLDVRTVVWVVALIHFLTDFVAFVIVNIARKRASAYSVHARPGRVGMVAEAAPDTLEAKRIQGLKNAKRLYSVGMAIVRFGLVVPPFLWFITASMLYKVHTPPQFVTGFLYGDALMAAWLIGSTAFHAIAHAILQLWDPSGTAQDIPDDATAHAEFAKIESAATNLTLSLSVAVALTLAYVVPIFWSRDINANAADVHRAWKGWKEVQFAAIVLLATLLWMFSVQLVGASDERNKPLKMNMWRTRELSHEQIDAAAKAGKAWLELIENNAERPFSHMSAFGLLVWMIFGTLTVVRFVRLFGCGDTVRWGCDMPFYFLDIAMLFLNVVLLAVLYALLRIERGYWFFVYKERERAKWS